VSEPARPETATSFDRPAPRGWYAWSLGGLLPLCLLGFGASAVADRPVFLLWLALAGAAWALALMRSFRLAPQAPDRRLPLVMLLVGLTLFILLVAQYRRDLAEGLAALLPMASSSAGGTP